MTQPHYYYSTGKRKTSIARVKLLPGDEAILINGKPLREYFPQLSHQQAVLAPFRATETLGQFHAVVKVEGGGVTGQSEAVRHGIARSLVALNPQFRPPLKAAGLLTRDARAKERKKYGLKRARKAPQYTKR